MEEWIQKLQSDEWRWETKELLVTGDERITEQQFYEAVRYAKDAYEKEGIKRDERVLLIIPPSVSFYITLIALWGIGACPVVLDSDLSMSGINVCFKRAHVVKVISTKKMCSLVSMIPKWRECVVFCDPYICIGKKGKPIDEFDWNPEREALVSFTSGSTSEPKGIVRTFGFLMHQREEIRRQFIYEDDDIDLAVMPIFTIMNFTLGIKTVIPKLSLKNPKEIGAVIRQMNDEKVTRVIISPFLAQIMVEFLGRKDNGLPNVKKVFVGGGPIHANLIEDVKRVFHNASCYLLYGCSEAEPIALYDMGKINNEQRDSIRYGQGLVAGKPCLPLAIIENRFGHCYGKLSQEKWEEIQIKDGIGEIVVSGPCVLGSYLDGIGDESSKIWVDGVVWHRTGDLGQIKKDGVLYLYGRAKEAVWTSQSWVYPFAVESKVYSRYSVEKVAFLADSKNKPVLVVQGEAGQIRRIIEEKEDEEYEYVLRIDKMPMDKKHLSKIDYGELHKWLEKGMERS